MVKDNRRDEMQREQLSEKEKQRLLQEENDYLGYMVYLNSQKDGEDNKDNHTEPELDR